MTLNIQNAKGETIGTIDLKDDVFGGRVKTDLIWASVVQENAAKRRGTRATKNRAIVSGGGRSLTSRRSTAVRRWVRAAPRCGVREQCSARSRGATSSTCRRKCGSARCARLAQKLNDGAVIIVDRLETADGKTKGTVEMFRRLVCRARRWSST